jgi:hypothetical protein
MAVLTARKADYDSVATGKWIPVLEREMDLQDRTVPIPEQTAGDVIIRARVRKISGRHLTMTLRQNPSNRGSYCAWFAGGHLFGMLKSSDDGRIKNLGQWWSPVNFDERLEFAFSAVGEVLTVYADGKRIGEVRDRDHRLGSLAIGAFRGRSLFQNVEIMILDEPVPTTDKRFAAPSADRRAAEWVLSLGGTVGVRVNGELREIAAETKAPPESFVLERIGVRNKPVTGTDLARLEGLSGLRDIFLDNCRVGDAGLSHVQYLTGLSALTIYGAGISDEGLPYVKNLVNLTSLGLFNNPDVTDAGLVHLKGLTNLTNLDLNATRVSDEGLAELNGLTNLKWLNLMQTRITGTGLVNLKKLTKLEVLYLYGSKLTDRGLSNLEALTKLNVLSLDYTQVGDAGLMHLRGLTRLGELYLGGTPVDDAGLVHLKKLTSLRKLALNNTQVSDAGLVHLNGMRHLAELNLANTRVTAKGVAKLKAALPKCNITQ